MDCVPGCFQFDPNCRVNCVITCPEFCQIPVTEAPKHKNWTQHTLRSIVPIVAGLLLGIFFVCLLFMIWRRYRKMRANQRIRAANPPSFVARGDFVDDVHMIEIDHPIWHIRTVGLQESFIDSIPLFKYMKEEGVVESTDCAVCLNEFEEDESLRRLPKCSHAFHISCIDTWLRSHQNCPVCRAPVAPATSGSSSSTAANLSAEESQIANIGSNSESAASSDEEASETNEANGSSSETMVQSEVLSSSSGQYVCDASDQGAIDKSEEVSKQGKGKGRENRRISDSLSFRNLQIRPNSVVRSFSSSGKLCASSGV